LTANLAEALCLQGKHAEAEKRFGETLALAQKVLGPEHPVSMNILVDMGRMFYRQRRFDLAESSAAKALDVRRRVLGSEHRDTALAAADLAIALHAQGKFAAGEAPARESLAIAGKVWPQESWKRLRAIALLGGTLAGQKKFAEAEPLLLQASRGLIGMKASIPAPERFIADDAREWLVEMYKSWGKPDQANALLR
jgi:tetratricopeptide (TPR) repeat protein